MTTIKLWRHNLYFSQCVGLNLDILNFKTPWLIWLKFGTRRYLSHKVSASYSKTFQHSGQEHLGGAIMSPPSPFQIGLTEVLLKKHKRSGIRFPNPYEVKLKIAYSKLTIQLNSQSMYIGSFFDDIHWLTIRASSEVEDFTICIQSNKLKCETATREAINFCWFLFITHSSIPNSPRISVF